MNIPNITERCRKARLRWYGHVRKLDQRWYGHVRKLDQRWHGNVRTLDQCCAGRQTRRWYRAHTARRRRLTTVHCVNRLMRAIGATEDDVPNRTGRSDHSTGWDRLEEDYIIE